MAMVVTRCRMLAALVAGVLGRSSAEALCEGGALSESCRRSQTGQGAAQDHLLIQVQRGTASRTPEADPSHCSFAVPPQTSFYWEPNCTMGMAGCWADGVHAQCRFCDYEYIQCPPNAWRPIKENCDFDNQPLPQDVGYYYEESCVGLGCNADGKHQGCRFCGAGAYAEVPCKVDQCTFANEPATPYYYYDRCEMGMLGCEADGIHVGCRFCGRRPFDSIPCPASAAIPAAQCWFRNEPATQYYWDANCTMGKVGCWADGIHAECRFCGGEAGSPFATVPCP